MIDLDNESYLKLDAFEALVVGLSQFMPQVQEEGLLAFAKPGMNPTLAAAWQYYEDFLGDGLTHDRVLDIWHQKLQAWWPFETYPEHFYEGHSLCLDNELTAEAESFLFRTQARVFRVQLERTQIFLRSILPTEHWLHQQTAHILDVLA